VNGFVAQRFPQILVGALCVGLASSNLLRAHWLALLLLSLALLGAAFSTSEAYRVGLLVVALTAAGWWWGSARLAAIDRSPLALRIGTAERARVVVTGPARRGRYDIRQSGTVVHFGHADVHEPVLLKLPRGRAPPQGAILAVLGQLSLPAGPKDGFDERTWLRRHGVHVVLRVDSWDLIGHRGGIAGFADAVRRHLRASIARGLDGERAAVLEGVVLGEDSGLSGGLRARFRAAGLYHLLAVSGQNVALVAAGVLMLAWVLGIPRVASQIAALAAIGAYVLAVGAQPSVVRAGIAGALGSLAWLTARSTDRWHFLLVGAIVLLAWNPYALFDAGFQLSFVAVFAIFMLVPRLERFLEGYPLGGQLRTVVAVSAACGLATAPIVWLQFHSVQVLSVPANALAAPAVAPLLGLALAATAVEPFSAGAAAALAWLNGWCAGYLILVARIVGGLPFAQIRSTRVLLVVLAGVLLAAAYASPRWRRPSSSPSI
jgi:competence protein ComEC